MKDWMKKIRNQIMKLFTLKLKLSKKSNLHKINSKIIMMNSKTKIGLTKRL